MAVTSGFFNSVNGDRKYNAEQMSAIFDGIINDGVFSNVGTAFAVKAGTGNTVNVGIGRAWFNSTWIYNDAILPVKLDDSELVLDRIDAIVFEVDHTNEVRDGTIKVIKGTPGSDPKNPEMTETDYVHQHPLVYILRKAGSTEITQGNITNMIGTSSCPYVTGILQVQNIDNIVAQWQAQWIEWFAYETAKTEDEANAIIDDWTQWYATHTSQNETKMAQWMAQMQSDFNLWLQSLKDAIGDDAAATLSAEVVELQNKFDTLMREKSIYDDVLDSSGEMIKDSDGLNITGKTVFEEKSGGSHSIEDLRSLIDLVYPVGSIYMSVVSASPEFLFGGTWERIEGRFLLGASDKYEAGSVGGEEKHKLTVDEMPSHKHKPADNGSFASNGGGPSAGFGSGPYWYITASTNSVGGDQPHNNMPPYLSVYMWKRIG